MIRKTGLWFIVLFSWAFLGVSVPVYADNSLAVAWQRPGDKWLSFTTDHFQVNYLEAHQAQAERAARIAEAAWPVITRDLNWEPRSRIQVVLVDDFDFSNGFATPLPYNQMRLYLSPPENMGGLESYDDWFNLLITHELTHVVHLDMAMGAASVVRNILGRNIFTFPHAFTPGFLIEGLAVYKETDHELGIGRGQSSNYEMLMRQEVINGIDDLSEIALPLRDWPFGKQYLYGYYYYQFLFERYGEHKVTRYLNAYSRQLIPFFRQNRVAEYTFGKNHEALWIDFRQWLQTRFEPQIERIASQDIVAGLAITGEGFQHDPITVNRHNYFYQQSNGVDRPVIVRYHGTGQKETLVSVKNLIDMDVTDDNRFLVTRYLDSGDGRGWADIFTIDDGDETRLTFQKRYRSARWLGQGKQIVAKSIRDGISQLDLLDTNGVLIRQIWRGSADEVLGDIAVSHDGKTLVASLKRKQQGWNLEQLNLDIGTWAALTKTRAIESGARFSEDDKSILFSANYDETYNLYRMDLASGKTQKISHLLGGAVKPAQVGEQIFYQNYSAEGYNHYQLADVGENRAFDLEIYEDAYDYPDRYLEPIAASEPETYRPWSTLRPRQWFPVVVVDDESSRIGVITTGTDALSRHSYQLFSTYDFDNELIDLASAYFYDRKWVLLLARGHDYEKLANTEDLNVRREEFFEIARINLFNAFENRLDFSAGISIDQESDLTGSGFEPRFIDSETSVFGVRFDYDSRESYSQSISPSWGNRSSLVVESHETFDSDFSGEVANINFSQFFDLPGKQVLVVNISGAYGTDSPEPFRLGGEDSQLFQPLFARDTWALRGYSKRVQTGTRIQTNSLEYRFSIVNLERNWRLFPVGLGQVSANIYIENGAAWNEDTQPEYLDSAGFEIRSELVLGYGMILPVNLGFAYGFDEDEGGSRGYLRIGYAF